MINKLSSLLLTFILVIGLSPYKSGEPTTLATDFKEEIKPNIDK